MIFECPGSGKFKQPSPENIACPTCGEAVEIWSDEASASCPRCKIKVTRKHGQSCLDWCTWARQCLGGERYDAYLKEKERSVADREDTKGRAV